ncbi:hypothetical protein PVAND_013373 [Polypedilum vanderplanki]|uniref:Uncharacterized protein n=1 Tax=Polypedilum vanderplanki TaxID=319348 RepID=A0A9J6CQH0_POLVA|nr:hypothetical protein PVAND_013373 [Polypedilum vanderplanki]
MTSPSMKSAEKKTPEKKASAQVSESEQPTEGNSAEQQRPAKTPLEKLNLKNYAWFRVFRFANLLCKQEEASCDV